MTDETPEPEGRRGLSKVGLLIAFLPMIAFLLLAAIFFHQLGSGSDPSVLPSALIGKPAPALALEALTGADRPALTDAAVKGRLTLVNVWASWCVPCRQEAPAIMALSQDKRINVVGINYKDKNDNAIAFLGDFGNPFAAIGVDPNGAAAIDWGVYGIPESYLVDAKGKILFKKVGPFDQDSVQKELMPQIEKALAEAKG